MPYKIELTRAAQRGLASLPKDITLRLDATILQLAENPYPRGCKKLQGSYGLWRVRVGNYRIIYQVEDDLLVILVVKIGHRRNVYS